jgi:hypothetical protein
MMLVVQTQISENYGAHDWDGEGQCPQYWKMKGGREFKVTGIPLNIDFKQVIDLLNLEDSNDYYREWVISWSVESDNYLSWFEESQMDYDGAITSPEPTISYRDLVDTGVVLGYN